jgi:hypothetical protein
MFDTAYQQILSNPELHPQYPKYSGSFNYQSGPEITYFFRTGLMFLDNDKDDDKIIIPIGLALTVRYLWIDGSWKITVVNTVNQPVRKRRGWMNWGMSTK